MRLKKNISFGLDHPGREIALPLIFNFHNTVYLMREILQDRARVITLININDGMKP